MAIYYVDYSGSAGTGDGSSFANRASHIKNITQNTLVAGTDEIRIKGNPITSLGTAQVASGYRNFPKHGYNSQANSGITYSTTTGQTYFTSKGWQTGDRIFIYEDTTTTQPSLVGLHTVTVNSGTPDNIYIDGYTGDSSTASGSIKYVAINTDIFTLNTTGLTKEIASMDFGRSAWTAANSDVTTSLDGDYGASGYTFAGCVLSQADKIVIGANAAVGKLAHYQLPSELDLSNYQQLSFLVYRYGGGTITTKDTIRLCSDTDGNTTVHTASIDVISTDNNYFKAVVADFGTNMGSSIKSIAIYREASESAVTYGLQNFIACKASSAANSLTHKSCVGLNDTIPIWYNVAWIKGDQVCVKCCDGHNGTKASQYFGGYGAKWTQTGSAVNMYKVEPFTIETNTNSNDNADQIDNTVSYSSATDSDFMTISGGWNATDMSSLSGATIIRGNEIGKGIYIDGKSKIWLKDLSWHNWRNTEVRNCYHSKFTGIGISYSYVSHNWYYNYGCQQFKLNYFNGNRYYLYLYGFSQAVGTTASDFNVNYCGGSYNGRVYFRYISHGSNNDKDEFLMDTFDGAPSYLYIGMYIYYYPGKVEINTYKVYAGTLYGTLSMYAPNTTTRRHVGTIDKDGRTFLNGFLGGFTCDTLNRVIPVDPTNPTTVVGHLLGVQMDHVAISTSNNFTTDIFINSGSIVGEINSLGNNLKLNGVTKSGYGNVLTSNSTKPLFWRNFNNTANDFRSYYNAHLITQDSTTVNTSGGKSLKATVLSTSATPERITLGSIMVSANAEVTISIYVYITGSNEQITLSAPMAPYLGLTTDQSVVANTASGTSQNTWTQISKAFTPTTTGKIDITLDFSNNSTSSVFYVDDFGVSQS